MYLNMSEDSILMSYLKRYYIIVAVSFVEHSKFIFKTLYDLILMKLLSMIMVIFITENLPKFQFEKSQKLSDFCSKIYKNC